MSPIFGEVAGNDCPECGHEIPLEGEFCEGQEVECECGALVAIAKIQATYHVKLETLEAGPAGVCAYCEGVLPRANPSVLADGVCSRTCAQYLRGE